jgi:Na+/proline symporter
MPGGGLAWANWIAGVVAVYATLFGIGKVVFGEWGPGLILLVIAAAAFAWIARSFRRVQDRGTPVAVVEPRA